MSTKARTKLSVINFASAGLTQIITLVLTFISRTVFIKVLGEHYLGLNGLYTNILSVLSFAELGIGAAMTFSLYKPLAEGDDDQILALMNLYRKCYHVIAAIIFGGGVILTPFLSFLIKSGSNHVGNIYVGFVLFLLNSTVSYLWNYKRSIFFADQNGYINSINMAIFQVITQVAQIGLLFTLKSYYVYLIIQIICTIASNFTISKLADKYYPILKSKKKVQVNPNTLTYLKKNVIGMISSKVGGIIVTGTDNLILSSFLGLVSVGMYSNYTLILNGLNSIFNQAVSAVTASIGNLQVTSSVDKQETIFYRFSHVSAMIAVGVTVGLVTFISPFIKVWVGAHYLFDWKLTLLLAIGFYITELRQSNINVTNAYGLYWEQRYKSIIESIINLVVSLILVSYFKMGIAAVIIGTLVSNLAINSWWEPWIVVKHGFKGSFLKYLRYYLFQLLMGGLLIGDGYILSSYLMINNILVSLLLSGGLAIISMLIYDLVVKQTVSDCRNFNIYKILIRRIK